VPIISWCGTYACLLHDVCSIRPLECKLLLQPVAGFIPLPESMVAQYWFHIERRFNYLGGARFLLPYPAISMITQYIQSRCSPSQSPFASRPSETIAPSYTFDFFVCFFPGIFRFVGKSPIYIDLWWHSSTNYSLPTGTGWFSPPEVPPVIPESPEEVKFDPLAPWLGNIEIFPPTMAPKKLGQMHLVATDPTSWDLWNWSKS
jgi:hypothetical protein